MPDDHRPALVFADGPIAGTSSHERSPRGALTRLARGIETTDIMTPASMRSSSERDMTMPAR